MFSFSRVALASTFLFTLALAVHAQREPGRQEARGVVKKIEGATITLVIGGGRETPAEEKTFTLAKDVEVCTGSGGFRFGVGFKEAKLADLTPGTVVGLSLNADKTVDSIVAEEPIVRGILKAADAKKNTVTISLAGRDREQADEERTFTLAPDAEVAIDDGRGRRSSIHEGKLDDLAQGAIVSVRLSLDKKRATAVFAEGAMVGGMVKSVDAAKRTLTLMVRPPRGDEAGEDRILFVAKEAVVMIDDGRGRRLSVKEVKLEAIPAGAAVMAKLSVDQNFVMMLKAEGPTLFGLLKGVDADKGTITIGIPKNREELDEKVLTVAKDARVTLDGNESKLADLKVGENGPFLQLRLTFDQKMVQSVAARQPGSR